MLNWPGQLVCPNFRKNTSPLGPVAIPLYRILQSHPRIWQLCHISFDIATICVEKITELLLLRGIAMWVFIHAWVMWADHCWDWSRLLESLPLDHLEDVHRVLRLALFHDSGDGTECPAASHRVTIGDGERKCMDAIYIRSTAQMVSNAPICFEGAKHETYKLIVTCEEICAVYHCWNQIQALKLLCDNFSAWCTYQPLNLHWILKLATTPEV